MMPTIDVELTGERIKMLMDERGMSVKDVREKLGEGSLVAIYKWINGQHLPSIDNLVILSRVFEVPIEGILVVKE
jgi:transcriptional regulator with XRE-family HTH domain